MLDKMKLLCAQMTNSLLLHCSPPVNYKQYLSPVYTEINQNSQVTLESQCGVGIEGSDLKLRDPGSNPHSCRGSSLDVLGSVACSRLNPFHWVIIES